jgi:hypothetical protein
MNPAFRSALRSHGGPGTAIRTVSGTIPANVHPPADSFPQNIFATASAQVKPVQVRMASGALDWSMGAFFGNLFGSKRDNTTPNVRESSGTQAVQGKVQAAPIGRSAAPAQTKFTSTTRVMSEAQRTTESKKVATTSPPPQEASAEPASDAGDPRTTKLLTGAVPAMPAGSFQNQLGRAGS